MGGTRFTRGALSSAHLVEDGRTPPPVRIGLVKAVFTFANDRGFGAMISQQMASINAGAQSAIGRLGTPAAGPSQPSIGPAPEAVPIAASIMLNLGGCGFGGKACGSVGMGGAVDNSGDVAPVVTLGGGSGGGTVYASLEIAVVSGAKVPDLAGMAMSVGRVVLSPVSVAAGVDGAGRRVFAVGIGLGASATVTATKTTVVPPGNAIDPGPGWGP